MRHAMHAAARSLLCQVDGKRVRRELRIRTSGITAAVVVVLLPAGDEAESPGRVGLWLSTAETLIVDRVREAKRTAPRERITQAVISARAGLPFDQGAKALIRNLVDRKILIHDDATGYELAPGV